MPEDEILETLAAENDEDAILVMQFEDSIADTIQSDSELSAFYSTYQDARRRLSERVKVRGFWPVSKRFDMGFEKKGKANPKERILSQDQGVWPAELPTLSAEFACRRDTGRTSVLRRTCKAPAARVTPLPRVPFPHRL